MSKSNGDRARAHRQQKFKILRRHHSRALGLALERQATEPILSNDGNQVVPSRLRQSTVNGQADPNALESVASQAPQELHND